MKSSGRIFNNLTMFTSVACEKLSAVIFVIGHAFTTSAAKLTM